MVLQPTGDYFGGRAIELAGIIIHPDQQGKSLGSEVVGHFVKTEQPKQLVAYTRNPALLYAVGRACNVADVLTHDDPERTAASIPHATVEDDGNLYHLQRYAPHGLYGSYDPAQRTYNGRQLAERCKYLADPNNALAISVERES